MISVLGALLLLAAPDLPKVGLVCVGPDATAAGEAQLALEVRLGANARISLAGPGALAPFLARTTTPEAAAPGDPALAKQAAEFLRQATDAYYEGGFAFALDRLAALAALHERAAGVLPFADRLRLLLWRAATFRSLKDEIHADEEALAALSLNPDLKVDLAEFPPSVEEAVQKARPRLRIVTVTLGSLPPGTKVFVSGRPVGPTFRVVAGSHRMTVTAPGRREIARVFEASGDVSLSLSLPLDLAPEVEGKLADMVWRGALTPESGAWLADLARKAGLSGMIVTASRPGESRGLAVSLPKAEVVLAGGSVTGVDAPAALAVWSDGAVGHILRPKKPLEVLYRRALAAGRRLSRWLGGPVRPLPLCL